MTLSFTGATWRLLDVEPAHLATMARGGSVSPVAARCMALRWPAPPTAAQLRPTIAALHDPYEMFAMHEAVALLRQASGDRLKVRIITDYDVDGTTSSLILQAALGLACPGLELDYHIPDRFTEGYGFSPDAARKAADDGVGLIVTADIGVRDHAAVQAATERGLKVLICDHHLPAGASVPVGATVLCPPQAACSYPNPHLAACGVSTKLAQALLADHPKRDAILTSILKLAAIGTIADMVPVTTLENRAIVTLGLAALNRGGHTAGLQALLDIAGLRVGEIDEDSLGFQIGPRINAAGRVAHAGLAVKLLTSRQQPEAGQLAKEIDRLNVERRRLQATLVSRILGDIPDDPPPFLVVAGQEDEGYHRGVVGIVAARLKDKLHRPVAVVAIHGEHAVASVRSTDAIHAVRALDTAADLLVKYGGHPAAAGFTVPTAQLAALQDRLSAYVLTQTGSTTPVREHLADAELHVPHLDNALLAEIEQMRPFGMGNVAPRLLISNVSASRVSAMGKERDHLRFDLGRGGSGPVEAVWWRRADLRDQVASGPIDVLGRLQERVWQGRRSLQVMVDDVRAHV